MNQPACSAGAGAVTGFEGPEKRLEIDFTFNNNDELFASSSSPLSHLKSKMGFRAISLERWQEMCTLAKCTIMNSTHNDHFDSYVLSESSLFVYPTKVMIKTCGTTTLLNAIPKILEYARELDLSLSLVMYSRKNFIFPKEQLFPHRGWDSEVEFLDTFFDGNSYVLGSMNTDHWCLYLADYSNSSVMNNAISSVAQDIVMNLSTMQHSDDECERPNTPPMSPSMSCSDLSSVSTSPLMISPCSSPMLSSSLRSASFDDLFFDGSREEVIVDIMMQDLDRTVAKTFYRSPETGDFDKYPGMAELLGQTAVTDEFNFTPCGYSMNGLLNEAYYTIHITPEPHCSYASFETNVNFSGQQDAYHGLIKRVLSLFKPGRVTLAFSSSIIDSNNHPTTKHTALRTEFPGYITRYKTVTQALEGNTRQVTMCNLESADYFAANQQTLAAAKAMKRHKLVSSSSATPIAL